MVPEMVRTEPDPRRISPQLDPGLPQLGGRQPQVVVGGEVDDLFAVELRLRGAGRFEHAQALVGAFRPPLFNVGREDRKEGRP